MMTKKGGREEDKFGARSHNNFDLDLDNAAFSPVCLRLDLNIKIAQGCRFYLAGEQMAVFIHCVNWEDMHGHVSVYSEHRHFDRVHLNLCSRVE